MVDISDLGLPLSTNNIVTEKTIKINSTDIAGNNSDKKSNIKLRGRLAEYQYIVDLLQRHQGSKSKTAAFLGITPRALRYRLASMRDDGIDLECYS